MIGTREVKLKRRYNVRIYSLILVSFLMVLSLAQVLSGETKSERIANFISFLLYVPMWIYILKK